MSTTTGVRRLASGYCKPDSIEVHKSQRRNLCIIPYGIDNNVTSQAAFHMGPSWAKLGPTGAHLEKLLGLLHMNFSIESIAPKKSLFT